MVQNGFGSVVLRAKCVYCVSVAVKRRADVARKTILVMAVKRGWLQVNLFTYLLQTLNVRLSLGNCSTEFGFRLFKVLVVRLW